MTVNPAAVASFAVIAPSNVPPTDDFVLSVVALDQFGNTVTNFSGPLTLTCSDGQTVFLTPTTPTWNAGVATFMATLDTADTVTLTATSGSITGDTTIVLPAFNEMPV